MLVAKILIQQARTARQAARSVHKLNKFIGTGWFLKTNRIYNQLQL